MKLLKYAFLISIMIYTAIAYQQIAIQKRFGSYPIKKGGLGSFNQMQLLTNHDYQYYSSILVGNQAFTVVLDTGSNSLWIPFFNCSKCPQHSSKFDPAKSTSFKTQSKRYNITYGMGYIQGMIGNEMVGFEGLQVDMEIVFVDYQNNLDNNRADGIMGLGYSWFQPNIFDIAYQQGQILSPIFGFKLGMEELRQTSYFYFNISKDDFDAASYVKITRIDYWMIPVKQLRVGSEIYEVKQALIDTGTSIIFFPSRIYQQLEIKFLRLYCSPYANNADSQLYYLMRECMCPSQATYPNITIVSQEITFDIMPEDYILRRQFGKKCLPGIAKLDNINFIILGDTFLRHYVLLFDKQKSRIGFIQNHRNFVYYIKFTFVTTIFKYIALFVIIATLGSLIFKQKGIYINQTFKQSANKRNQFELGKSGSLIL